MEATSPKTSPKNKKKFVDYYVTKFPACCGINLTHYSDFLTCPERLVQNYKTRGVTSYPFSGSFSLIWLPKDQEMPNVGFERILDGKEGSLWAIPDERHRK